MMMDVHIHIVMFGAGGVGGYFEGCLACAGKMSTIIARGKHLQVMQLNSLSVESIDGN
jgi:2-dehydropantoate 2-reductase